MFLGHGLLSEYTCMASDLANAQWNARRYALGRCPDEEGTMRFVSIRKLEIIVVGKGDWRVARSPSNIGKDL